MIDEEAPEGVADKFWLENGKMHVIMVDGTYKTIVKPSLNKKKTLMMKAIKPQGRIYGNHIIDIGDI